MLIGHLLQSSSGKFLSNQFKDRGKQTWRGPSSLPLPARMFQNSELLFVSLIYLFVGISTGLSIAQSTCHLAVLGQVESSDLLGLLNLLLVGLHLELDG